MSPADAPQTAGRSLRRIRDEILADFPPEVTALYAAFVGWLVETGVCERALKVGDRAPDFLLPDAEGVLVSSRSLRRSGPLVVSFFRGAWCPFCTAELSALAAAEADLRRHQAHLLAITPETGSLPRELKRNDGLGDLRVLSDVDYGVSLSFGVVFPVPANVRRRYTELMIDLPARHGTKLWMLPIPATYVVDRGGIIRDAYVEADFSLRMEPSEIIGRLQRLSEK